MILPVVMLCCFVAPPIVRADPTEDAAIKAIKQLGGKVEQNGKVVDLSSTQVTDAELKELAALKDLTTLDLSETRVTDAGLKELAALKDLTTLNLSRTRVRGAGLKELAALKNLTTLYLRGPGPYRVGAPAADREPSLNDAGLKELAALKDLTTLDLTYTNVTDAGLKELAALENLTNLDLTWTNVTDAGLKELAALEKLTNLDLTWTNVTDAGLKELATLKNLTTLDLSSTNVTGAGMRELAVLKNLTTLYLRGPGSYLAIPPAKGPVPSLNDAGAKGIAALESLTALDLSVNQVSAAILNELAAAKNLVALNLSSTSLRDAEMKELAALPNLRILYLHDCWNLTDDGVKQLATLKNLTILDLGWTKISDPVLMELSAIPGLARLHVAYTKVSGRRGEGVSREKSKVQAVRSLVAGSNKAVMVFELGRAVRRPWMVPIPRFADRRIIGRNPQNKLGGGIQPGRPAPAIFRLLQAGEPIAEKAIELGSMSPVLLPLPGVPINREEQDSG